MDPAILKAIQDSEARIRRMFAGIRDILLNHRHLKTDETRLLFARPTELLDAATIESNAGLGSTHFFVTLGGNRTLGNPENVQDGDRLVYELIQDGTGSRTITLGSKFVAGPWTVTLTTTASKRDFIEVIYRASTDKLYVINFQKGF